jgi:hypothetical protein
MKKKGAIIVAILVAVLAMLEILPRNHTNPPVRQEPAWNQPETRLLAKRACFNCHSNETKWAAYSIATLVSWLIQRDVNQGRSALNFSEWDRPQTETAEVGSVITGGKMPPELYLLTHPEPRLTQSERTALLKGVEQTLGEPLGPEARTIHPKEP